MSVGSMDDDPGKKGESNGPSTPETTPKSDNVPNLSRVGEAGLSAFQHFDSIGAIPPLSPDEQAKWAGIQAGETTPGEEGLLEVFVQFQSCSKQLLYLINEMNTVAKPRKARFRDMEQLESLKADLTEGCIQVLQEMHEEGTPTDKFISFAAMFIYDETEKRVTVLREIFNDPNEESFASLGLPKVSKRVAKRASVANSDAEMAELIGIYFGELVDEDIAMASRYLSASYHEHDVELILKNQKAILRMLKKVKSKKPSFPDES